MTVEQSRRSDDELWTLVRDERAAFAEDLERLTPERWRHATLCGQWDVEEVVAHLVAAASTGRWAWLRSMLGARFRPDVHNRRRLEEHRGSTPAETLERFRAVVASRTAPSRDTAAYLGEVVVHAQDVRRPLGITRTPDVAALTPVAEFYAARDFAVESRTVSAGLRLAADDGPFAAGEGPLVTGPTLALVMVMAGRSAYLDDLSGPGVATLRDRLATV
ncbi:maleylpyruvate isomerase family mycothiol-dependent enzyme [Cellulomonas palmilytica]|uniref:maleylpyruvate isomerase family mycothiol-dependent enzyme n=1 Tax=Cellulomonas palmilytica TaxID=2608402 RepID=UPI001F2CC64A|nr:maleylpyruvate isomerase family mycothiol-dependent enzyme [Cellulomonas palmilytica]UJP40190.1 maleylpyruvate isomerase family mycothiol-dependent enzyme [Cellulomonas palmilytica]